MTDVRFSRAALTLPDGAAGEELRLIVAGHAGYGEKGRDIVCAAESILVQALACGLAAMEPELLQDFTVEGVAGSGCVGIAAIPQRAGEERVRGLFSGALTGFALLEAHYPAYVRVVLERQPDAAGEEKADA